MEKESEEVKEPGKKKRGAKTIPPPQFGEHEPTSLANQKYMGHINKHVNSHVVCPVCERDGYTQAVGLSAGHMYTLYYIRQISNQSIKAGREGWVKYVDIKSKPNWFQPKDEKGNDLTAKMAAHKWLCIINAYSKLEKFGCIEGMHQIINSTRVVTWRISEYGRGVLDGRITEVPEKVFLYHYGRKTGQTTKMVAVRKIWGKKFNYAEAVNWTNSVDGDPFATKEEQVVLAKDKQGDLPWDSSKAVQPSFI